MRTVKSSKSRVIARVGFGLKLKIPKAYVWELQRLHLLLAVAKLTSSSRLFWEALKRPPEPKTCRDLKKEYFGFLKAKNGCPSPSPREMMEDLAGLIAVFPLPVSALHNEADLLKRTEVMLIFECS